MSKRDAWSQDVVLGAMCGHIGRERHQGLAVDFVLVTGDIAFSGKAEEYALAEAFLDELNKASGVPKEKIYCIPGNHDIDRNRHGLCFKGARATLKNQGLTDSLLAGGEDLEALLKRQENYRKFQVAYFVGQERTRTEDGLAYVSRLQVDEVHLAVIGLDSAWLAEGGMGDHGKLLVGERQAINAVRLALDHADPPHVVICMAHHPFHLLQDFDRRPVQERIERVCDFFLCGHLHEAEARATGERGGGCLTLAAGASFETRQTHNTYSVVTLDLLHATRTVRTVQYRPANGTFSPLGDESYEIDVKQIQACSADELASAIAAYDGSLSECAHYLAALLLDLKAEVPVPFDGGYTFAAYGVMKGLPDSDLKKKTGEFLAFRNVLRVLHGRTGLGEIFETHGNAVREYGECLLEMAGNNATVKVRLKELEEEARLLAKAEAAAPSSHGERLMGELAEEEEWALLAEQAERHLASPEEGVATTAKQMRALALAHFDEPEQKKASIAIYESLRTEGKAEARDLGNLATLLIGEERNEEAKVLVLEGVKRFPAKAEYFRQIGQRIVEATGDRAFREKLDAATNEKRPA